MSLAVATNDSSRENTSCTGRRVFQTRRPSRHSTSRPPCRRSRAPRTRPRAARARAGAGAPPPRRGSARAPVCSRRRVSTPSASISRCRSRSPDRRGRRTACGRCARRRRRRAGTLRRRRRFAGASAAGCCRVVHRRSVRGERRERVVDAGNLRVLDLDEIGGPGGDLRVSRPRWAATGSPWKRTRSSPARAAWRGRRRRWLGHAARQFHAELVARHVARGEDRDHAGQGARGRRVGRTIRAAA